MYGYSLLFKSSLYTTSLSQKTDISTLVPVFDNQKKSEEDFCFYKKW